MERREMPVYEYQCTGCGQIEEALQKISDSPLETCPHCKGHLKKLISQSTFHLKGSGWYVTDYGGAKNSGENKSEAKPDSKKDIKTKANTNAKSGIKAKETKKSKTTSKNISEPKK